MPKQAVTTSTLLKILSVGFAYLLASAVITVGEKTDDRY
jgi:hypothetical protein